MSCRFKRPSHLYRQCKKAKLTPMQESNTYSNTPRDYHICQWCVGVDQLGRHLFQSQTKVFIFNEQHRPTRPARPPRRGHESECRPPERTNARLILMSTAPVLCCVRGYLGEGDSAGSKETDAGPSKNTGRGMETRGFLVRPYLWPTSIEFYRYMC